MRTASSRSVDLWISAEFRETVADQRLLARNLSPVTGSAATNTFGPLDEAEEFYFYVAVLTSYGAE